MKKRRIFGAVLLALCILLCSMQRQEVNATSTSDKLRQVQQDKKETEQKKNAAQSNLEDLKEEKTGLQSYLNNLNADLSSATDELARIEQLIAEKNDAIEETKKSLEEAKEKETQEAKNMKLRMQFIYEKGSTAYLDMLFSTDSFSEFLTMYKYVEKVTTYDRESLKAYKALKEKIIKEEEELEGEQAELEALLEEAKEKKSAVEAAVKEAQENVQDYMAQISEEEKRLIEYEKAILAQENDEAALQKKLEEERAISAMVAQTTMRDLSSITFGAGDIDMMAAIIECEAGGEPYTGKVAVGAVVMNRVKSPLFPDTVAGVIYQNKQFSPVGSGRFAVVLARGANQSCYEAAQEAMAGATPVGNCVFFRTPIPGLTGIQIGGHIFY
ncbi:MAG: cell wall hydrolase [Roseburia sp.]|nr:cell wall hydrolase [Roseburia sp.]MCM1279519.1 cell wall hydrolase [Robinsoniella sp.]